jgi:cystathionine gamma-lyase
MTDEYSELETLFQEAEDELQASFSLIDRRALAVQKRVLQAFAANKLTEEYFAERTGYGIDDYGRDVIDKIFADIFEAEAASVRMQFVSGTHAIACALFGNLRPGEKMVSLTGQPYDTLLEVIGLEEGKGQFTRGSLKELGVSYAQLDINPCASADELAGELAKAGPAHLYHIQKSRGYSMQRKSFSNLEIQKLIQAVKTFNKDAIVFVDNCYGEFVEEHEPTFYGADLVAGSLIKNPGGGLALTGGYVAGRARCVEGALLRLTAPGIGGHLGITFNQNRLILQGVFLAPSVVSQALKGALLAAHVFTKLGLKVDPGPFDKRYDIIQAIEFGAADKLINFCRALQKFSPVNAHVAPEPSDMPGYADQVIMAGGSFIEGATIELSADGPLRAPFAAYMQGGLSYLHVKCALMGIMAENSLAG